MNPRTRGPRIPAFATSQIEVPSGTAFAQGSSTEVSSTREVIRAVFPSLSDLQGDVSQPVGQTVAPWSGCDVYVVLPRLTILNHGTLSVFVWAITNGTRVLVGTGRVAPGRLHVVSQSLGVGVWVAAVRGLADSWEVTAQWQQNPLLPVPEGATLFTICASNEPADPPEDIGSLSFGSAIGQISGGVAPNFVEIPGFFYPEKLELLSLGAINGVAAPRFLHIYDHGSAAVASVAGAIPMLCFPLGSVIGEGVVVPRLNYRSREFLLAVASSTLATTTVVADCLLSGMVR